MALGSSCFKQLPRCWPVLIYPLTYSTITFVACPPAGMRNTAPSVFCNWFFFQLQCTKTGCSTTLPTSWSNLMPLHKNWNLSMRLSRHPSLGQASPAQKVLSMLLPSYLPSLQFHLLQQRLPTLPGNVGLIPRPVTYEVNHTPQNTMTTLISGITHLFPTPVSSIFCRKIFWFIPPWQPFCS